MSGLADRALVDRLAAELQPAFQKIESARQIARAGVLRCYGVAWGGGIALAVAAWLSFQSLQALVVALLMLSIVAPFLASVWAAGPRQTYKDTAANALVPAVCDRLGGLSYARAPGGFAGMERFTDLGVVGGHQDKYSTFSDQIAGSHRDTGFRLAEAELRRPTRINNTFAGGHGKNAGTTAVFAGLLFVIAMPREIAGRILIARDKGGLGNTVAALVKQFGGRERVRFDDPEFERRFQVYATHQEPARAVLGEGLRRTFCTIDDMFRRRGLQAAFDGCDFLLAVKTPNRLEDAFPVFHAIENPAKIIARVVNRLTLAQRVIDHLHGEHPTAAAHVLGAPANG
ncbi:MAG: DUF3137 domain-containing protein [Rhodospirillaceae bacterium]|nr:DUF3137 domain-containing protein [Rhodospirillaceae bacterium]